MHDKYRPVFVMHLKHTVQYRIERPRMESVQLTQFCSGDQIEKKMRLGGPCSTYGGEENYMQGFGGETWTKEITWKT